jgi:ATP-dependent Clp protease ATP-binding subunit ClpC
MFERFTERARQVVVLAQEEARSFGHNYIGTEHILLGLLREEEGLAAKVLNDLGLTYLSAVDDVERITGSLGESPKGQIPFTPRGKKVFENSLRESLSLGQNYIGTEHILLGLVRETDGVALRILLDHDISSEDVRNAVIRELSGPAQRKKEIEEQNRQWQKQHKTEAESSKKDGLDESEVRSTRGLEITICGDLTLLVGRDTFGRLKVLIKNPSDLPLTISEK